MAVFTIIMFTNSKIKLFIYALVFFVILIFFSIGIKFTGLAKNIYEFENTSKGEIVGQVKDTFLNSGTGVKKNPDGTTNILFLGIAGANHNGENLTDTIIVATISPDRKNISLNSIPRDLFIESSENSVWKKVNSVYASYAKTDSKAGIKTLAEKTKEITGLPINYYVLLDFKGFEKVIDAVGGIEYTLQEDLNDPGFPNDNFGYDPLYLKAGTYHLDGALALKLSRSRHTTTGDFSRIERQHGIIKALKDELENQKIWGNFFAVNNILNIISENIKTNITLPEFQKFNEIAKNIPDSNITSRIPDAITDSKIIYAANINGADVLLPKDPSYSQLRAFYQGKEIIDEQEQLYNYLDSAPKLDDNNLTDQELKPMTENQEQEPTTVKQEQNNDYLNNQN